MSSYIDQMYGAYYNEYSLYHHGIKGQKWGIRRFQNEDGTRTAEGKKRMSTGSGNTSNIVRLAKGGTIGSAARVRKKQQMFNAKIAKGGDKNLVTRNIVNDWRRGRVAQLDVKARHREARDAYRKDKSAENRKNLRSTRAERIVKNGLGFEATTRGTYNRYRQNGKSIGSSVLATAGKNVATNIAIGVATKPIAEAGKKAVQNMLM